jgi:hypothetical protein
MPEGPEVRRHADALNAALRDQPLIEIAVRLRGAKAWLQEHPELLIGRQIERVHSHGKNLIVRVQGDYHFVSPFCFPRQFLKSVMATLTTILNICALSAPTRCLTLKKAHSTAKPFSRV